MTKKGAYFLLAGVLLTSSPLQSEEADGVPLFDGESLSGWEGAEGFWRAQDGVLIGETTKENMPKQNTFLIFTEEFADFELRFEYQVEGYNSGVQYRSEATENYGMKGLQADFEARWHNDGSADKFTGMFFEEKGRMFLGKRGEMVVVRPNPEKPNKPKIEVLASLGDPAELESAIQRDGWNEYVILAKGNHFTHIINGQVMAIGIDKDPDRFRASGKIGFQLHKGKPMKIQLKNIRIREIQP